LTITASHENIYLSCFRNKGNALSKGIALYVILFVEPVALIQEHCFCSRYCRCIYFFYIV